MTDLGDYHNFYLLTKAHLLADVFENFREVCLQHYGLNPAHNYTSPGLFRQAALKKMYVELDFLTDIDWWGVEKISQWYARANAPSMENYDANKRNSYIIYLIANNLYGWAMS